MIYDPAILLYEIGPEPADIPHLDLGVLVSLRADLIEHKERLTRLLGSRNIQGTDGRRIEGENYWHLRDKLSERVREIDIRLRVLKKIRKQKSVHHEKSASKYLEGVMGPLLNIVRSGHKRGVSLGLRFAGMVLEVWAEDEATDEVSDALFHAAQMLFERSNRLADGGRGSMLIRSVLPELQERRELLREDHAEAYEALDGIEVPLDMLEDTP